MTEDPHALETIYGPLSAPDWPGDLILRVLAQHGEWAWLEARLA